MRRKKKCHTYTSMIDENESNWVNQCEEIEIYCRDPSK